MESACELFVRCLDKRRDEDWNEFLHRYGEQVRQVVQREMNRQGMETFDDLDDYVQILYLRLLTHGRAFSGRDLWGYLAVAARNVVIDDRRSAAAAKRCMPQRVAARCSWPKRAVAAHPLGLPLVLSPEERLLARERLAAFAVCCRRAVLGRPKGRLQLRILALAFVAGMTSVEIAGALRGRVTPCQVNSLIHRLRGTLAKAGVDLARRPYAPA